MPRREQAPPPDYYADLAVAEDATQAEIRQSYRELVLKVHPDKQGDAADFRRVHEAYEVLHDAAKRERYDAQREAGEEESDDEYSSNAYYTDDSRDDFAHTAFEEFLRRAQERARQYNHGYGYGYDDWDSEEERAWAKMRRQANERRAEELKLEAARQKQANMEKEEGARANAIAQEDKIHAKLTPKSGKKAKQAPSRKNCTCKGCQDRFLREQDEKNQLKSDPQGYAARMAFRDQIAARKENEAAEKARREAERLVEEQRAAEAAAKLKKQAQEKAAAEQAARQRLHEKMAEQQAKQKATEQAAAEEAAQKRRVEETAKRAAREEAERAVKELAERKARETAEREAEQAAHRLAEQQARQAAQREAAAKLKVQEKARQAAEEANLLAQESERLAQEQVKRKVEDVAAKKKADEKAAHRREMQQAKQQANRVAKRQVEAEATAPQSQTPQTAHPDIWAMLDREAKASVPGEAKTIAQWEAQEAAERAAHEAKDQEVKESAERIAKATRDREVEIKQARADEDAKREVRAVALQQSSEPRQQIHPVAQAQPFNKPQNESTNDQKPLAHTTVNKRSKGPCKFGARCKYIGSCKYSHEEPSEVNDGSKIPGNNQYKAARVSGNTPSLDNRSATPCKYGSRCMRGPSCKFLHIGTAKASTGPEDPIGDAPAVPSKPTEQARATIATKKAQQKPVEHPIKAVQQRLAEPQAQKLDSKKVEAGKQDRVEKSAPVTQDQAARDETVSHSTSQTVHPLDRLELAYAHVKKTKLSFVQDQAAQGNRIPSDGVHVNLGWVRSGKANKCHFCQFKHPTVTFRCPDGGAKACNRCKKSLSLITQEDETMMAAAA